MIEIKQNILFSNDRFYAAINSRDLNSMRELWGPGKVKCIHPGWKPIIGFNKVIESWESIFIGNQSPNILCRTPEIEVWSEIGIITCFEQIGDQYLCATNIFCFISEEWRMIHHQAGPVRISPDKFSELKNHSLN